MSDLPDLPEGWNWANVDELALAVRNGVFVSRPGRHPPGTRILRISAVRPNALDRDDVRYADPEPARAEDYVLQEGDLLFTRYSGNPVYVGACAAVGTLAERTLHPDKLIRVVVNEGAAAPRFVQYAVNGGFSRLEIEKRLKTTAGQVGIAGSQLRTVPIPVAPLSEQERIVAAIEEHLSRLDAAVAGTARAIHRVRGLKTQIIDAAMSLAGESATLDSYAAPGGITDGPFGSKLKSSHYTSDGPRVVRLENIGVGDFIDEQTHISTEYFEELRKHEAVGGDIVVASLVSERLRACIVPMGLGPAIVKADCIRVRLSHGTDSRFVKYSLMRSSLDDFVAENVRGVGRSRLGLTNVRRIPVPLADQDAQRRIADGLDEKLAVLARVKSQGDEALRRATALRRAILAAAFSGQLVPQDPDDEPASVLLERIRDQRAAASPSRRTRAQAASR